MLIGLTGKYCAGKNHIADILEKRGLKIIDADKLGHQVLETEKEVIFPQFGFDLKKEDCSLDRRLLGQKVFGKPEKLAALEAIVHPSVDRLIHELTVNEGVNYVINAALLHRAAIFTRLDLIILITAPFFTRFMRARRRDRLSFMQILKRFMSQMNFETQYLSINAEIERVENPGLSGSSIQHRKLENRIEKILEGIY
jgi:dephospho-CoA kinase